VESRQERCRVLVVGGLAMRETTESVQSLSRPFLSPSFSLPRNSLMFKAGAKPPKAMKTGTTIVGVVYDVRSMGSTLPECFLLVGQQHA
jgi:hypothetical protein